MSSTPHIMLISLIRKSEFLNDILKKKYFHAQLSLHPVGIYSNKSLR